MLTINMIFARSENGVIGNKGVIPWTIPEDMKRFRELTMGHPVIMGRKTWDSLPLKFRPLPGRQNFVLTRQTEWKADGAHTLNTLTDVIMTAGNAARDAHYQLWVIGGSEVYNLLLPIVSTFYVTEVKGYFHGDAYAPHIDLAIWSEVSRETRTSVTGQIFSFVKHDRIPQYEA